MSRYYPPVTVTGNPVNFSAPNGGKLDSVSVQIIPTQDLHGYANPWPAGGGVNMLDYSTASASDNSVSFSGGIYLAANQAYTFSYYGTSNVVIIAYVHGTSTRLFTTGYLKTYTFTPTEDVVADITYYNSTGITSAENLFQAEKGSISHDWSPYSNICPISGRTGLSVYVSPTQDVADATTYAVDWITQAGTVYGGTLNVVTGELVVDRGRVNVSSSWYWYKSGSYPGGFYATIENAGTGQKTNTPFICSHAKTTTSISQYVQGTCFCDGSINIRIMDGSDTVQDWKDYINAQITAGTPIQICYELATPITYQLTPKQIAALIDQNYIWSSNNETISVVYALLVPGSDKYTLIVNGVDIADFVERDSYRTTLYPVFSEAVQTLDGVGHTALLRKKGELSARFNPRTAADTAIICAALLNAPCEVQYHCLQRNADVTALMTIDSVSALYLSRCLYCRQKWNDIDSITLTEL